MKLCINGTYRSRVRINFLFFWVVRPWRTENVDLVVDIPDKSTAIKVKDFELFLASKGDGLHVELDYLGFRVFAKTFGPDEYPVLKNGLPIKVEPIKGARLDVVASLQTD